MEQAFNIMIPGAKGDGSSVTVVAPWDLSPIAQVPAASKNDIELALSTAYSIFRDRDRWLSIPKRIEVLEKTAELQPRFSPLSAAFHLIGWLPSLSCTWPSMWTHLQF